MIIHLEYDCLKLLLNMFWLCRIFDKARTGSFLLFIFLLQWNTEHLFAQSSNSVNDAKYFITLPKALLLENQHKFFVQLIGVNKATIQIDTTDPSTQLRVAGEPTTIKDAFGEIIYRIPFDNPTDETVQLHFFIQLCPDQMKDMDCNNREMINRNVSIKVIKNNFLLFGETSKPIYKPGELIQFRFLPVYPTTLKTSTPPAPYSIVKNFETENWTLIEQNAETQKTATATFDMIYLEDPNRSKMLLQTNVTWKKALQLSYQLTKDPVLGKWKAVAKYRGRTEIQLFDVKKYVLPKFTVEINPPKDVIITDDVIEYSVCVEYSNGRPMRGTIKTTLCMNSEYKTNKIRPCVQDSLTMLGGQEACYPFRTSTKKLELTSRKYNVYGNRCSVNVTVIEEGTDFTVNKEAKGGTLTQEAFTIDIKGPDYHKPGLPYYGKIIAKRSSGVPQKFTKLQVSCENNDWGFTETVETGYDGTAELTIPSLKASGEIFILVAEIKTEETLLSTLYNLKKVTKTKSIKPWSSITKAYIQAYPLNLTPQTADEVCNKTLTVILQANVPLNKRKLIVQGIARGQMVSMQKINPEDILDICEDRDNELGHYKCINENSLSVTCLEGWTGNNCLTAVCENKCMNGVCAKPGQCMCKEGWKGDNCDQCIKRKGCVNGICIYGDDCQCNDGWKGWKCKDRAIGYKQPTFPPITYPKDTLTTENKLKETQEITIFQRTITLKITPFNFPGGNLIIYFEENGINRTEIIAESIKLTDTMGNDCVLNTPTNVFKFDREETSPGSNVTLKMNTERQSEVCALRISDISLEAFGSAGGVNPDVVIQQILDSTTELTEYSLRRDGNPFVAELKQYCDNNDDDLPRPLIQPRRNPRSIYYGDRQMGSDSATVFENAGIFTLTNANIFSRTCRIPRMYQNYRARGGVYFSAAQPMASPEIADAAPMEKDTMEKAPTIRLRQFFPETWKFEYLEDVPETSRYPLTVPDTLTKWKAEAYCMSEKGLWASKPNFLTVTLPFNIHITLPYSIKRGEILNIPVKIFNYLKLCFKVVVEIESNNALKVIGQTSTTTCLCNGKPKTVYFKVWSNIIGKTDVVVKAYSKESILCTEPGYKSITATEALYSNDAVKRQLLVQPEGIPQDHNFANVICLEKDKTSLLSHRSQLPESIVEGSERKYILFSGDVMGASLDNLDSLVKMPYGCGEQNMVSLVPSIYVLDYFTAAKIKNPEIKAKAKKYIKLGFERQLKYLRNDGSYSAFGMSDKNGSTWLTTFVYKSFKEASEHVTIDRKVLEDALKFIQTTQNETDGCLREYGKVLHNNMKGGVGKGDEQKILLTAYLLTGLPRVNVPEKMLTLALKCVKDEIKKRLIDDTGIITDMSSYASALFAHALGIHEPDNEYVNFLIDHLITNVKTFGMSDYWSDSPKEKSEETSRSQGTSSDVETTAYAYLATETYRLLEKSMKIIRWLTAQRNPSGGFYSTQDTVVGLKAISNFARRLSLGDPTNINVVVKSSEGALIKEDTITSINQQVMRKIDATDILSSESATEWIFSGTGCLFAQSSTLYNIPDVPKANIQFQLTVESNQNAENCQSSTVNICFAYTSEVQSSNMIMLIINKVSGWSFIQKPDTLINLYQNISLKRVEDADVKYNFYFDPLELGDTSQRCVSIDMKQEVRVDESKPAEISLYDYYSPEISVEKMYSFQDCKDPNEIEIPKLSPTATTLEQGCPSKCLLTEKIQQEWLKKTVCTDKVSFVVVKNIPGRKQKDFLTQQGYNFHGWTADLPFDSCQCLTPENYETDMVLLTADSKYIIPNQPIIYNENTFIINARFAADILARNVWCGNAESLNNLLADTLDNVVPIVTPETMCPTCLENYDQTLLYSINDIVCNSFSGLLSINETNVSMANKSIEETLIYNLSTDNIFNVTQLSIDSNCYCPINLLTNSYDSPMTVVMVNPTSKDDVLYANGNVLITTSEVFKNYEKVCNIMPYYRELENK